jgi:hypothetical protein
MDSACSGRLVKRNKTVYLVSKLGCVVWYIKVNVRACARLSCQTKNKLMLELVVVGAGYVHCCGAGGCNGRRMLDQKDKSFDSILRFKISLAPRSDSF